jgi:ribosomal protein S18 acetylase RimI-like enzyme
MPKIDIRRLLPSDVSAYRRVRLEALQGESGNYGSTYEEESQQPKLIFETYIENQSNDHRMFGIFIGDNLRGIAGYARGNRKRTFHRAHVTQVYVAPSLRGKGMAKKLMETLIEDAFLQEGLEILHLKVVASNPTAVKLYERLGFTKFGLFKKYFKNDGDYLDQYFMSLNRTPKLSDRIGACGDENSEGFLADS